MGRNVSVNLPEELVAKLEKLATGMGRPRSELIHVAILRLIEDEWDYVMSIQQVREDIRSGKERLIPHEEVMEEMERKIRARLSYESPLARTSRSGP